MYLHIRVYFVISEISYGGITNIISVIVDGYQVDN